METIKLLTKETLKCMRNLRHIMKANATIGYYVHENIEKYDELGEDSMKLTKRTKSKVQMVIIRNGTSD
jgi:hypothetical protein